MREALPSFFDFGPERRPLPRGRTRLQFYADRRLLAVEAALLLAVASLLVKYVPMRHWRSWLTTARPAGAREPSTCWHRRPPLKHVTRVVPRVAAVVPFRAVCLQQAMATQWMLHRRGVRCRLLFGVQRAEGPSEGDAEADVRSPLWARFRRQPLDESDGDHAGASNRYHAWLAIDEVCVLGGNVDGYRPFPPIDALPRRRRRRER